MVRSTGCHGRRMLKEGVVAIFVIAFLWGGCARSEVQVSDGGQDRPLYTDTQCKRAEQRIAAILQRQMGRVDLAGEVRRIAIEADIQGRRGAWSSVTGQRYEHAGDIDVTAVCASADVRIISKMAAQLYFKALPKCREVVVTINRQKYALDGGRRDVSTESWLWSADGTCLAYEELWAY